jgi:hypothetical protein
MSILMTAWIGLDPDPALGYLTGMDPTQQARFKPLNAGQFVNQRPDRALA